MTPLPASAPHHRERLAPPWWLWAICLVLAGVLTSEVTLVGGAVAGVVVAATTVVAVVAGLRAWVLRVEVSAGALRAGRARIKTTALGETAVLEGEALRLRAGRDADPAAYLALRPWTTRALEIAVDDPADPTPYWLIGSQDPARLEAAIAASRGGAG